MFNSSNLEIQYPEGYINNEVLLLQIHYVKDQVVRELFNPFSTIAVWAAVRFVINKSTTVSGNMPNNNNDNNNDRDDEDYSCAFLPLISDPGEEERRRLFQPMSDNLKQILMRRKVKLKRIIILKL